MDERQLYYFDNNATTAIDPEVFAAMEPFLKQRWGNPSSSYRFGQEVSQAIKQARQQVARLIQADPRDIIFTSCGTESNNTAIHSALVAYPHKRHVITTAVEHSANIKYGKFLESKGYRVTFLPVDNDGLLDLGLLDQSIRPDTAIVSIMWANNETGILFPIPEIAALCRSRGVLFHTDAVQAAGKIPIDAEGIGMHFLSLSAHKLHAPKGIGMLYIRRRVPYHPLIIGGQQESGRRGGTENVPYIVGFGKAAELALQRLNLENTQVRALRDRLEQQILKQIPRCARNGAWEPRLPNTLSIGFEGVEAEAVLLKLDQVGICASSGSACTSGALEPSHVLRAMNIPLNRARGTVRFSLSVDTTSDQVDFLLQNLVRIIAELRGLTQDASSPSPSSTPEFNVI